jgi:uncharacterized protein YraI
MKKGLSAQQFIGWLLAGIVFLAICPAFSSSNSSHTPPPTRTPISSKSSSSSLSAFSAATSTKRPISLHACVTDSTIRIRRGPGTQYEAIGGLVSGTCMSISGRNQESDWVYITSEDNKTGWVAAWLLTIDGNVNTVSVSNAYAPLPAYTAVVAVPPAKQKNKSDNSNSSGNQNQGSVSQGSSSQSTSSGASAVCKDGSLSYSTHNSGTCSYHGGVSQWLP